MTICPYVFQVSFFHFSHDIIPNILNHQCGAAIFELCPKSALFKLPALANQEVQTWMKTTFWTELSALQAAAGSSVYLAWIQNEALWQALEENWCLQQDQKLQMEKLIQMLQQQTVVLSPTQGFSTWTYAQWGKAFRVSPSTWSVHKWSISASLEQCNSSMLLPSTVICWSNVLPHLDNTGVYEANDSTLWAFTMHSHHSPHSVTSWSSSATCCCFHTARYVICNIRHSDSKGSRSLVGHQSSGRNPFIGTRYLHLSTGQNCFWNVGSLWNPWTSMTLKGYGSTHLENGSVMQLMFRQESSCHST